ncbi:MAG: tetratricopeptide repeat protein [Pseudomonadota bacterium]|nr:tetratricopeptide repeat protein [Pseudomonadota bacterium]
MTLLKAVYPNSMKIHQKLWLWATAALLAAAPFPAQADGQISAGDYLSGQFARDNGDMDSAIRRLQQVLKEQPGNTMVAGELEGMLLLEGHINEATVMAEEIRKLNAKDPLSGLVLALRSIKNNQPEDAAKILDATQGGSAQLWLPLVSAWLDFGRHKLDKPLTVEGLSADVGHARPLAYYHLALVNAAAGFTDAAAQDFKNAVEDPRSPSMRVMRMLLAFYEKNGHPAALTPIVEAYRDSHPGSDEHTDTAIIATVQDGVSEVLFSMGGIMLGSGMSNDAAIYLQLALFLRPDFPEAQMALADSFADQQDYARANDIYGKIAEQSPLYRKAQMHIAVNEDRSGKLSDALERLDRMAQRFPADADALITRGDLLRVHGRYGDAVDSYTQAISRIPELKSNQWPLLFARGACYERIGKWQEAEKDLRQALALQPDEPDVLNYLAYGWLERGESVSEARAMLEKAFRQRPDDAQIADSMGWSLYLSGNYEEAAQYIEKAVDLLPGDPTVNDHLGDVYWRLGHKTEARYQWERSLNSSPETRLAGDIQKKLKDGLPPIRLANTVTPVAESKPSISTDATP